MEWQDILRKALYVSFTFLLQVDLGLVADPPTFRPEDKKVFHDGSSPRYYRQLMIDQDNHYVYVGAMDHLYRLSADDISQTFIKSVKVSAFDRDVHNCRTRGKSEDFDCKNHIRTIVDKGNLIYACGTGSYSPVEYEFSKTDLTLLNTPRRSSGQGQCPLDPSDSFACVYVRHSNPGNMSALYTGTVRDFYKNDPLIHREELKVGRKVYSDLLRTARLGWFQEGTVFVGAFETPEHVYFFFRETAEEFRTDEKTLVSRVARVCKKDRGAPSILQNKWTTFLKARLNCSIPGPQPFYFNEIRAVQKFGQDKFVGLFTTVHNGLYGTAVCSFTLAEVDKAFSGTFWEKDPKNNQWTVAESSIPSPRPGTCIPDSTTMTVTDQHFIERHPFVSEAVQASDESPLYYQSDVIFTHMVIDQITTTRTYTIYFLATDQGKIYKVAEFRDKNKLKSKVVAIWKPFGEKSGQIWSMNLFNGFLYLATDTQVIQLRVTQCGSYELCTNCVQDPYCGWNQATQTCEQYKPGYPQGLDKLPLEVCNNAGSCFSRWRTIRVRVLGDAIVLKCDSYCAPDMPVNWWYKNKAIEREDSKYIFTQDHGLVILNATKADEGSYMCVSSGKYWLTAYEVELPDCTDPDCIWQEEFRHWCNEFDRYRKEFNNWLCYKNECYDNNNCVPQALPQCHAP